MSGSGSRKLWLERCPLTTFLVPALIPKLRNQIPCSLAKPRKRFLMEKSSSWVFGIGKPPLRFHRGELLSATATQI